MTTSPVKQTPGFPKEAEPYALHVEDCAAIEEEMRHYDDPRAASIGALKIVQKRHGWVPDAAIPAIGRLLGISAADVEGVATFYSLIFRRPVGGTSSRSAIAWRACSPATRKSGTKFAGQLGVGLGETTADGRFTLLPICCLGACDKGPVLMIDDDTHFDVSPRDIARLLERYP